MESNLSTIPAPVRPLVSDSSVELEKAHNFQPRFLSSSSAAGTSSCAGIEAMAVLIASKSASVAVLPKASHTAKSDAFCITVKSEPRPVIA